MTEKHAIEAAAEAIRKQGGFSDDKYEHGWSVGYARAAILAYLSAIAEDEGAVLELALGLGKRDCPTGTTEGDTLHMIYARRVLQDLLSRAKEQKP